LYIELLEKLKNNESLTRGESKRFIDSVFTGKIPSSVLTEFLMLLNKNGFGSEELTGFAISMREASNKVAFNREVIDNCGTGGDGYGTFNISTTASLIAASVGVYVAKHGNKAVTSSSGSADILEASGININLSPEQVSLCLEKNNFGFMYAPLHHLSMKHVAESRKTISPDKTIFNLLGPLTNPAGARKQLIGVYSKKLMPMMAETLVNLDVEKAMIVHSNDGLDEISIFDETNITEINGEKINNYTLDPKDYFDSDYKMSEIIVSNTEESLDVLNKVIDNEPGAARDISLINAAALIYISGKSNTIADALNLCKDALETKKVYNKLKNLIKYTNSFKDA